MAITKCYTYINCLSLKEMKSKVSFGLSACRLEYFIIIHCSKQEKIEIEANSNSEKWFLTRTSSYTIT